MSVGYFFPHTWIVWLSWLCPARGLASFSIKLHIFHSERIPLYGHQIGALHLKLKRFIKYCKLRSVIKRLFRIFSVIIFKPDVEEAGLVVERQPCAHQCGHSLWALYSVVGTLRSSGSSCHLWLLGFNITWWVLISAVWKIVCLAAKGLKCIW